MKIEFVCKTNKEYVMINTLLLTLKSGAVLTIDRDETLYDIDEKGNLSMTWEGCYLWALDGFNIFSSEYYCGVRPADFEKNEFIKLTEGAGASFELEDDADEDYEVELVSYSIS